MSTEDSFLAGSWVGAGGLRDLPSLSITFFMPLTNSSQEKTVTTNRPIITSVYSVKKHWQACAIRDLSLANLSFHRQ